MKLKSISTSTKLRLGHMKCLADHLCLHRLVLESLKPVPADRKCFRLINGVLVERSVGDVIPALETNAAGLKTVLEGLVKEYKKQQSEMEEWKVCYEFLGGKGEVGWLLTIYDEYRSRTISK